MSKKINELMDKYNAHEFKFTLEDIGKLTILKLVTDSHLYSLRNITVKYLSELTSKTKDELYAEIDEMYEKIFEDQFAEFAKEYKVSHK
ncbi:MAG: hypothetical protein RDU14_15110 [Melioribacteraceae bacterium]|nr:hypothetical protein [Melioribacteraceae bacterium]